MNEIWRTENRSRAIGLPIGRLSLQIACTFGFIMFLTRTSAHAQATFRPLSKFGGVASTAYDVSADGTVIVGTSIAAGPTRSVFRVTPQGTTIRPTGFAGPVDAPREVAVSADGSTVVGTFQSPRGEEAFRWVGDGPFQGLGDLPGGDFRSNAYGASADGSVIIGSSQANSRFTAFRWTAAVGMQSLTGDELSARAVSADGSVIVGSLWLGNAQGPAYRWTVQTGPMPLPSIPRPGFMSAEARAVSADGSVVVGYNEFREGMTGFRSEAFRWTAQQGTISMDSRGWRDTVALDVSADGTVVVGRGSDPATTATGAFIWTAESGMYALRDFLVLDGATGLDDWTLVSAEGVSADGLTVVGTAFGPNGQEAFVATIPEPSTIVMSLLAAMAATGVYCLRRQGLQRGAGEWNAIGAIAKNE